jgi:hypothetical protein
MAYHSAASVEDDELTLSDHGDGDLLILLVYRDGSTAAPTNPGGWTAIQVNGSNSNWFGLFWRRATSSSETSGTWTNATHLACWVGRAANYLIPGTATVVNAGTTTTISYTARTAADLGGFSSVLLGAVGVRTNNTSADTAPSGMTNRTSVAGASTGEIAIHDTGSAVSSWTIQQVVADGTVSGRASIVVEIRDTGIALVAGSASSIQSQGNFS